MDFEALKARFFEALDRENGSVTGAARAVGVNRHTAASWARKAGVRGRGKPGRSGHPGRAEYERLRAAGVRRRDAAARAGVHERTAQDWDHGIRQIGHSRLRADGRLIDYTTGVTTIVAATSEPSVVAVDAELHPRFLTVAERELMAVGVRQVGVGSGLVDPAGGVLGEVAQGRGPDDRRSAGPLAAPCPGQGDGHGDGDVQGAGAADLRGVCDRVGGVEPTPRR